MTRPKFRQHFNADPLTKEMSLKDGRRVLFPEGLKVDGPVFLVTDKGEVPMPIGSYELLYGKKFTVAVVGIISTLVDDVKAGKMSFRSETLLRKEKARFALANRDLKFELSTGNRIFLSGGLKIGSSCQIENPYTKEKKVITPGTFVLKTGEKILFDAAGTIAKIDTTSKK